MNFPIIKKTSRLERIFLLAALVGFSFSSKDAKEVNEAEENLFELDDIVIDTSPKDKYDNDENSDDKWL